jgi:hypothetical protein
MYQQRRNGQREIEMDEQRDIGIGSQLRRSVHEYCGDIIVFDHLVEQSTNDPEFEA